MAGKVGSCIGLPWRRLLGGNLAVKIDRLPVWRLPAAAELLLNAARRGDGISTDEFSSDIVDMLKNTDAFIAEDERDGSIVSLITIRNSILCRSTNPRYESGYLVVSPHFRGRGSGLEHISIRRNIALAMGYTRTLARTTVTARTLSPLTKLKTVFCGLIPGSIRHIDGGFADDLIVYSPDESHLMKEHGYLVRDCESSGYSELPPLSSEAIPRPAFPATRIGYLHDKVCPTPGLPDIEVGYPTQEELVTVEKMIRSSALKGDGGFAVDEFNADGLFNRNFFKNPTTVVFRTVEPPLVKPGDGHVNPEGQGPVDGNVIIAAAIFGASNVCRSAAPELACLYVVVDPLIRCEGIGKAVQSYMERLVGERGFKGVLSDIFATNKAGISMSMNGGYMVTGSLPNCGYIKGNGLTNSLLVYKRFDDCF